ncbi:MAG TPA: CocE/NonD family hydrolase [Anaerolineaceae bacterium]|nr:CocE/NonD family hydrolase [Anaerolineaceae bacterium]
MSDHRTEYRNIIVERDVYVTTKDNVRLACDIYRPDVSEKLPALLIRIPYNKTAAQAYTFSHPIWYARYGYIVVSQDTRGRYKSGGDFYPLKNDDQDGLDTIEWVSKLPYCNGQVGTYGFSYGGMDQLLAATKQPKNLVTMVPAFTGSDLYTDWNYSNGAFSLAFNTWWTLFLGLDTSRKLSKDDEGRLAETLNELPQKYWTLPLSELFDRQTLEKVAPYYFDWLNNPARNEYWKAHSVQENYEKIQVPGLHIGGWYDAFVEGNIRNYEALSKQQKVDGNIPRQRLIIGPWYHMPWSIFVGSVDFGSAAINCLDDYLLQWFDYWLKGKTNEFITEDPVKIFIMGENRWRNEKEWPIARTVYTNYYLHSKGRANSISGNGQLDPELPDEELNDIYVYDPNDPVPSKGGRSCCVPLIAPMGPEDQRPVEIRNDVLVYSTKPLEKDIEVTGMVKVELWASSTAQDTDFTAKLIDVFPDGRAINICDGLVRARFRNSFEQPEAIEPDRIYRYEIRLGSTSNLFFKGHSIRLEISSSNFPMYDRNPNNMLWPTQVKNDELELATQSIFHDERYPSHIILPIIPREQ